MQTVILIMIENKDLKTNQVLAIRPDLQLTHLIQIFNTLIQIQIACQRFKKSPSLDQENASMIKETMDDAWLVYRHLLDVVHSNQAHINQF